MVGVVVGGGVGVVVDAGGVEVAVPGEGCADPLLGDDVVGADVVVARVDGVIGRDSSDHSGYTGSRFPAAGTDAPLPAASRVSSLAAGDGGVGLGVTGVGVRDSSSGVGQAGHGEAARPFVSAGAMSGPPDVANRTAHTMTRTASSPAARALPTGGLGRA